MAEAQFVRAEAGSGRVARGEGAAQRQNLQISVGIFDKGAAAFNPVSVIEVENAADRRISA